MGSGDANGDRMLRNLLIGVIVAIVGAALTLGIPGVWSLGNLASEVSNVREDISDLKRFVMEDMRGELRELESRIRRVESSAGTQ